MFCVYYVVCGGFEEEGEGERGEDEKVMDVTL